VKSKPDGWRSILGCCHLSGGNTHDRHTFEKVSLGIMLINASTTEILPVWGEDTQGELVCRAVTDETHDVRSFHFTSAQPNRFSFAAGQFLTFELPIGGQTVYRCYTISSPPSRSGTISITVKRVARGPVSNWLHDRVRPGTRLRATGPSGDFVLPPDGDEKLLLLSAGSGVTPLMSMARMLFDHAQDRDVVFIHSARSPADIVFREELALLARRLPRLRVAHIVEGKADEPGWPGLLGRLDGRILDLLVPDMRTRDVYCCGPAPYMANVRALLDQAGCDKARYHQESFSFEALPDPIQADVSRAETEALFSVTFAKSGQTVACGARMTVLAAAVLLHTRGLRHVQKPHAVRTGGHATWRRDSRAGDRAGDGADLLQRAAGRPGDRPMTRRRHWPPS
jgi:ferredoxin-NADP reductase